MELSYLRQQKMANTDTHINLMQDETLHLVILVRPKATTNATEPFAQQMVNKVADPIKGIHEQLDSAMSFIPGVLQEQTKPTQPIDEGFIYTENYPQSWDKYQQQLEENLKEVKEKNELLLFEYDDSDTQSQVDKLVQQVKTKINKWQKNDYKIHGIALSAGGNILGACFKKIMEQNSLSTNGEINTFIGLSSALKEELFLTKNQLEHIEIKKNYKGIFDLNANAIQYFEEPHKIIQLIEKQNQTPIHYALQNVLLKLTKIITIILNGATINSSYGISSLENIFNSVKKDITDFIKEIKELVQHIVGTLDEFFQIPSINNEVKKAFNQLGDIEHLTMERLNDFKEELENIKKIKGGTMSTSNVKLGRIFNCLVPCVMAIRNIIEKFGIDLKDNNKRSKLNSYLAKEKIATPFTNIDCSMIINDPYVTAINKRKPEDKIDEGSIMIHNAQKMIIAITDKSSNEALKEEQLNKLTNLLLLPMLASKIELLGKIVAKLSFLNGGNFIDKLKTEDLLAPLAKLLGKATFKSLEFDDTESDDIKKMGLKHASKLLDTSITDLKQYFNPSFFKIEEQYNSLHFIYNCHNNSLKTVYPEMKLLIDKATGIYAYKLAKGYGFDYNTNDYKAPMEGVHTAEPIVVTEVQEHNKS